MLKQLFILFFILSSVPVIGSEIIDCKKQPKEPGNIEHLAANFAVVSACQGWIDEKAVDSFYYETKACICGAFNPIRTTAVGFVEMFTSNPYSMGQEFTIFLTNIKQNVKAINDHLEGLYKSYPELSYAKKKAINCEVITNVAFFGVPLAKASVKAIRKFSPETVSLVEESKTMKDWPNQEVINTSLKYESLYTKNPVIPNSDLKINPNVVIRTEGEKVGSDLIPKDSSGVLLLDKINLEKMGERFKAGTYTQADVDSLGEIVSDSQIGKAHTLVEKIKLIEMIAESPLRSNPKFFNYALENSLTLYSESTYAPLTSGPNHVLNNLSEAATDLKSISINEEVLQKVVRIIDDPTSTPKMRETMWNLVTKIRDRQLVLNNGKIPSSSFLSKLKDTFFSPAVKETKSIDDYLKSYKVARSMEEQSSIYKQFIEAVYDAKNGLGDKSKTLKMNVHYTNKDGKVLTIPILNEIAIGEKTPGEVARLAIEEYKKILILNPLDDVQIGDFSFTLKRSASKVEGSVPKTIKEAVVPLTNSQRLEKAEEVLGIKLDERQKTDIIFTHEIGIDELGRDKINKTKIGNYTDGQIRRKYIYLRKRGFTKNQIKLLMDNGIVGLEEARDALSGFMRAETIANVAEGNISGALATDANRALLNGNNERALYSSALSEVASSGSAGKAAIHHSYTGMGMLSREEYMANLYSIPEESLKGTLSAKELKKISSSGIKFSAPDISQMTNINSLDELIRQYIEFARHKSSVEERKVIWDFITKASNKKLLLENTQSKGPGFIAKIKDAFMSKEKQILKTYKAHREWDFAGMGDSLLFEDVLKAVNEAKITLGDKAKKIKIVSHYYTDDHLDFTSLALNFEPIVIGEKSPTEVAKLVLNQYYKAQQKMQRTGDLAGVNMAPTLDVHGFSFEIEK